MCVQIALISINIVHILPNLKKYIKYHIEQNLFQYACFAREKLLMRKD